MYGFIVTTHHNNYETIKKCLDLLFDNIFYLESCYIVLYVNETKCEKVLNIKEEYDLKYQDLPFDVIYIDNQEKNGGLTATWNQGIDYLLNNLEDFDCKVITILGHDTFINKDIKYLLDSAMKAQENNELKYFGPLCNSEKYTGLSLWQDLKHYKKYVVNDKVNEKVNDKNDDGDFIILKEYLTGFLMTFPVISLLKNKKENLYFNHKIYPFAGNEVEWYNRFKRIGGKPILCTKCVINHEHNRSWLDIEYRMRKNIDNNEVFKHLFFKNKIDELNFNWKSYLLKNPDLKTKGIFNEKTALDHYVTIGKYQKRTY